MPVAYQIEKLSRCQSPAEFKDFVLRTINMGGLDDSGALFGARVLVVTYIEPEKTSGGIIRTQKNVDEARWQGKVGLVIGLGHQAFKADDGRFNEMKTPQAGDWVLARSSDGWELTVSGFSCRIYRDEEIIGVLAAPEVIY